MKHPLSLSLFCAAACLVPALARSQPATGTVFVEGGAYADIRRAPSSSATLFGDETTAAAPCPAGPWASAST